MAVTSGFFNSLNGDRRYNAEQMSSLFDGIINDGVFINIGTAFKVSPEDGQNIVVGPGRAWFNSAWINNDSDLLIPLSDSEILLDRIDAVVIEVNHDEAVRNGTIQVITGVPSSGPLNPTLINSGKIHQYPLAYIFRSAGSKIVTQGDITNKVGTSECPYITGILQTLNADNLLAQWDGEFNAWFDEIKLILDDLDSDTVLNLASRILMLERNFEDLIRDGYIYDYLDDSSNDIIRDSIGSGSMIEGRSTINQSSESNGSTQSPVQIVESYKVGDVLVTARRDLDRSWLVCDGSSIYRSDYPLLADLFQFSPAGSWNLADAWTSQTTELRDITFGDGYYVAVGSTYAGSAFWESQVRRATSLIGPWGTWANAEYMIEQCFRSNNNRGGVEGVGFYNNYNLFYGTYKNSEEAEARLLTVSTLSSGSVSTDQQTLWSGQDASCTRYVYLNGDHIVLGGRKASSGTYACLAFCSDFVLGEWTRVLTLWTSPSLGYETMELCAEATCLIHDGNMYIAGGFRRDDDYNYIAMVAYTTSLTNGLWTYRDLWSGNADGRVTGLLYVNGIYIIAGHGGNLGETHGIVGWTDEFSSDIDKWYLTNIGVGENVFLYDLAYVDGYYVAVGKRGSGTATEAIIVYTTDPSKEWIVKVLWAGSNAVVSRIKYENGDWIAVGRVTDLSASSTNDKDKARYGWVDKNSISVPTITMSEPLRAYIKASE